MSFLAAAQEGDVLVAEATERLRQGRRGLTDVTVTRERQAGEPDATVIAEFRGRSRQIGPREIGPRQIGPSSSGD